MTDICNPPLMWIDGMCYRVPGQTVTEEYSVTPGYTGEEDEFLDDDSQDLEDAFYHEVEQLGNGNYKAVLKVASSFFPIIIGAGGQTKTRLETDTKTKISIPRKGQEGDISVTGVSKNGVITACNRIDVIVASARQKQPFTHFLSIPVNAAHIQQSFLEFKSEILTTCDNVRGLDQSIFQTETLLHLTIGTMALLDERERNLARELLSDCKESIVLPILNGERLSFEISGLEIMNDDPSDVDVLYGKILDKSGKLQQIVDALVDKFVNCGLMKKEYDRVKLHATLMNTLFRKDEGDIGDKFLSKDRESFDSRQIMETWPEKCFGTVEFSELHLSQRRAGRRTAAGYYLPSAIVQINSCS